MMNSKDILYSETPLIDKTSNIARTKISGIYNKDALRYRKVIESSGYKIQGIIPEEELFSENVDSALMVFENYSYLIVKADGNGIISRNLPINGRGVEREISSTANYVKQNFKIILSKITLYNFTEDSIYIGSNIKVSEGDIKEISIVNHQYGDILNNSLFKHSVIAAKVAKISSAILISTPIFFGILMYYQINYGIGMVSHEDKIRHTKEMAQITPLTNKLKEINTKIRLKKMNTKDSSDIVVARVFTNIDKIIDGNQFNIDTFQLNRDNGELRLKLTVFATGSDQAKVSASIKNTYNILTSTPYNFKLENPLRTILSDLPESISSHKVIKIIGNAHVI